MDNNEKIRVNRENIGEHLVEYQLNMVGKTKMVMIDDDFWRLNNPMTKKQLIEFREYAIPLLQKVFHFNKRRAEETFAFIRKEFGLHIEN